MNTTESCTIQAGETRELHRYPALVLSDCTPAKLGERDCCSHQVRFVTLMNRHTGTWHETSAFGWEFGWVVAMPQAAS